ncbi:MAG TPA: DNA cytosine methyltransferase [Holophagaceae bacterium]|nr:DNA cytosine methyltransferase [Holophagaceae bacterium]
MRALELFSGLGGWRYALGARGRVAAAYDISPAANATYALNHGEAPVAKELATAPAAELTRHGADTWLLSPPCQPFCRMGRKRDLEDPRSRAFLNLLRILEAAPPVRLALENVEGFLGSEAHGRLRAVLDRHGFDVAERRLCPSSLGLPNLRPRVYVVASRRGLAAPPLPEAAPAPLSAYLDPEPDPALELAPELFTRHGPGLDLARPEDRRSACFIGGYGQRLVGSGSFLRTPGGARRFSPAEIARLLGLPPAFRFPPEVSLEKRYKLLGNGLSVPAARWILAHFGDDGAHDAAAAGSLPA